MTKTAPKQLRITSLVSPKQKKQAETMAKDLSNGSVGELLRQLLSERFARYAKARPRRSASTTGRAKNFIRSSHVRPAKPARKRSTRNATANRAKGSTPKRASKNRSIVSRKSPGRSPSRSPKNR